MLLGTEAVVFLESVGYLRDMISVAVEIDEPYRSGVLPFDSLQPTQQMAAMYQVVTALLKPDVPAPRLNAVLEGTVYVIYRELVTLIELEIDSTRLDDDPQHRIRAAVQAGLRCPIVTEDRPWQEFEEENFVRPDIDCDEIDAWEDEVEELADRVLWDRDFLLEPILMDMDPLKSGLIKQHLGVGDDYFAIPAPDANSDEYRRIDNELIALRSGAPGQINGDVNVPF